MKRAGEQACDPPSSLVGRANGGGNYIAPSFQTKNIAGKPDGGWTGTSDDYTTAVVGNSSIAWIRSVAHSDKPWFAYIAPKAAHEPFIPAPWYLDHWDVAPAGNRTSAAEASKSTRAREPAIEVLQQRSRRPSSPPLHSFNAVSCPVH